MIVGQIYSVILLEFETLMNDRFLRDSLLKT